MEKINLLKNVKTLSKATALEPYSKIVIRIDKNTKIVVGDDTGRTLEYTDPFGTQQQAVAQLTKLRGFQYRSYEATGALLNPASEIGDSVIIKNVYGGVYKRSRTFGKLMVTNISAPYEEDIDHDYVYENTPSAQASTRNQLLPSTIIINNQEYQLLTKTIDGVTIHYLGFEEV